MANNAMVKYHCSGGGPTKYWNYIEIGISFLRAFKYDTARRFVSG